MEAVVFWLALFVAVDVASFSHAMHFHHSKYNVHHQMGKMKIKVKPEGAKLIFTGGDLDVDMHPAHGYVRPVHNVIVSNYQMHHDEPEFHHHDTEHGMHIDDEDAYEEHSGHHEEYEHHDYHHDDLHDDHHFHHGHHSDLDGYGFGHFHHFPEVGHGHGDGGLLHDGFFGHHDHDDHGHFRDEIQDSGASDPSKNEEKAASRHEISDAKQLSSEAVHDVDDPDRRGFEKVAEEKLNFYGGDAVAYGKKIFPEEEPAATSPTHKSTIESKMDEFAAKIVPGTKRDDNDPDDGSTPSRSGGTISPFDDENDNGESNKDHEDHLPVKFEQPRNGEYPFSNKYPDSEEHQPRFQGPEEHSPRFHDNYEDSQENEPRFNERPAFHKEAMRPHSRHSQERAPKFDYKKLEGIANSIPPSIPDENEFMEEKQNKENSRDIGTSRNVFVNMSGEPHNYGDENNEQGYPSRNNEMDPGEESRGDAPGDSYPHEDERENDFAERKHNFEPQEGDEERGMRQNMDEFRMRSQQIEKIANEAAKKKDSSPLVVHPNGDPRELDIKKAFYEFNPTHKQSKHLASILDFSVRSKIAKRSARSLKQMRNGKRGLMVDRLIARLKSNW